MSIFLAFLNRAEISIMNAVNDDGGGVIHQSSGAAIAHSRLRFVKMALDILIALEAIPFAFSIFSVK